jgi:SAM-dependent methyltransferase
MINPQPTPEVLASYYTADYNFPFHVSEFGERKVVRRKKLVLKIENFVRKQQVAGISRFIALNERTRVLDAGSGTGTFLSAVKRFKGSVVTGIDFSLEACIYAKNESGVPVIRGDLESSPFRESSFDLVTMWHVLEHTMHPSDTIATVWSLLKPGGLLILEVPNYDCPPVKKLGEKWIGLFTPMHLYNFNEKSLRFLIEDNDFEVVEVEYRAAAPHYLMSKYLMLLKHYYHLFYRYNHN